MANCILANRAGADDEILVAEADLIRTLSESTRDERGVRHCSRCGRDLVEGGFSVSLMGHGVACVDIAGCIEEMEGLAQEGSDHKARCALCGLDRPIGELDIRRGSAMLSCQDWEGCQRERSEIDEIFRRTSVLADEE